MEKKRSIRSSFYRIGAVLGLSALAVSGCSGPNYSGEGNEFVVRGKVTDTGKQSVRAKIYQIDSTDGDATDWFSVGETEHLHDNCDCHGFWKSRKKYGTITEAGLVEISPSDVAIGSCIVFTGKIRSNAEGKTYDDRPVYEMANIIPCPEWVPEVEGE